MAYYYRRRYRRYFKRYYKKPYLSRTFYSRKLAKAKNLNYYVAKINTETALFAQADAQDPNNKITGFKFGTIGLWGEPTDGLNFFTMLKANPEFTKYQGIFNEVMLLGCKIRAVPTYRASINSNSSAWTGTVNLYFNADSDHTDVEEMDPLVLNYDQASKYWKNINRHWYPSGLTTAMGGTGLVNLGYVYLAYTNKKDITQGRCPSWNLYLTVYLKFRKNRLNA